ncbi:UDP-glucuronosyltransferase 2C1-like [Sipha flava]|uniref:UDP-glucuronosyltransferase 2C1 n=1 Tax=Sipha flava TaxID=143950 RepID=A0A2S2R7Z1_9HEMI|nr:UDP-glucuronosyltransferase 2C1-like [Sipha flava]
MLNVLFIVFSIIWITNAANLLVFWPLPIPSHFYSFKPLFTELALQGHNVTVVSHFPESTPMANYTDITIMDETTKYNESTTNRINDNLMDVINCNFFQVLSIGWTLNKRYAESILHLKNLQNFITSESYTFDLVLIESFYQEYTVTMGHKFNAPVICITSTLIQPTNSHWIGLPSTFSYLLDIRSRSCDHKTFYDRLKSTYLGFVQIYLERYFYIPTQEEYINKYFNYKNHESRPPIDVMLSNVSLILVNGDLSVGAPRPYLPNVIEIGGLHIKVPKQLPKSIRTFIESAKNGVIFISFGTYIHPCEFPKHTLDAFIAVIGKLKQKILWRWACNTTKADLFIDNVMLKEWFPQFDILNHPNVKLFITHGGLHSVEESTYNAVPMIGVPFFSDQFTNIKLVERKGFGKLIEVNDITENTLQTIIDELLFNPIYKENAIAYSEIYKDGYLKPIDKAIYWIEYILRNNGAPNLKSYSIQLNSIQYFLIDILVLFLICIVLVIYLVYKMLSTLKTNIIKYTYISREN